VNLEEDSKGRAMGGGGGEDPDEHGIAAAVRRPPGEHCATATEGWRAVR
jgi:hypothetical protein